MELHDEGVPLSVLTLLTDFYIARIFTTSTHYYGSALSCLAHFITSNLFPFSTRGSEWRTRRDTTADLVPLEEASC